jgi:hypothetical protein
MKRANMPGSSRGDAGPAAMSVGEDIRLHVAEWVVQELAKEARHPTSYRNFIFGRLGFSPSSDAYRRLLDLQDVLNALPREGIGDSERSGI